MSNISKSMLPVVHTKEDNFAPIREEVIDFSKYWRAVKQHKFSIIIITLICLAIGYFVAALTTPVYRTETKLLAEPSQPSLDNKDLRFNFPMISLFYETQHEIINSRKITQKAIDKLDLVARYKSALTVLTPNEEQVGFIQQTRNWLTENKVIRQLKDVLTNNKKQRLTLGSSDESIRSNLANTIRDNLDVTSDINSKIVRISFENPDPQLAADIANAIAEAYVEFGLELRHSGASETSTWLSAQLQDLKVKLKESEDALREYQKDQSMIDTSQQALLAETRLSLLSTELIEAQTKRSEAEIRYNQILSKHEAGNYASLALILDNSAIEELALEVAQLTRNMQELSARYGKKHPKIISSKADLNEAKRNLTAEIDQVVDSIRREYEAAVNHEDQLEALIQKEKSDLGAVKDSSFEMVRLEREVLRNQDIYESFLNRFQEANVSERYDVSNIHLVDSAYVPREPFKPNKSRFILISAVLGLLMGIVLAFLREILDRTFETTEELEQKLNLSALGAVPTVKKSSNALAPEYQVISRTHSQFVENINNIRTGLLYSNTKHPPNTILVTSATGGEGKSILAINLAASLGRLAPTLLLDANFRRPSIIKYLDIEAGSGFTSQETMLEERVITIDAVNSALYTMPVGSIPVNPLELLSSKYFSSMLKKLKETFTYIVLDGPPVLGVSDATVIGQLVDTVIVAVKAESTSLKSVQTAIRQLQKANIHVTGTVLCQVDPEKLKDLSYEYINTQEQPQLKLPKPSVD